MRKPVKRAPVRLVPTAARRAQPRAPVKFVDSGSLLLNRALGGDGWAIGRVANLVGDAGSGKTLIAVEACANFLPLVHSADDIRYVEAEMAYDEEYGRVVGMPAEIHPIDHIATVEQLFIDLQSFCKERRGSPTPSLYVVDSLDAMSDAAELDRAIGESSYGTAKAKMMSEGFRRLITSISEANCHLLIVSQLRDTIGVTFGERQTRSGGRALQFYCSQITWLSELKKIPKTLQGVKHTVGTHVRARNKKSKVGIPFKEADLTLWFNYGIDDEGSMLDYLAANKADNGVNLDDVYKQLVEARHNQDREYVAAINALLRDMVTEHWQTIDMALQPPMRKYA